MIYQLTLTEAEKHRIEVALNLYHDAGEEWRRLIEKIRNTPGENPGCPTCTNPVEPCNETEFQPGGRGMARRPFCRACWQALFPYGM
jgi:hypothetical protein